MTGHNSGDPFTHIDEDEIERLAELATQRKRANGRIPTFGDDDYLDYVADVHLAGHITTAEALELERIHGLLARADR